MDIDDLASLIETEINQAVGAFSGDISNQRATALSYYYGEPFGNEQDGRSQVVSRDVADTIEWIMPSLIKIFCASNEIVSFEPNGPEDEQAARQATDYMNYVFTRLNNGFMVLYSFIKDALLQKNGFVKVYRDEYEERKLESFEKLPDDEFVLVVQAFQALEQQGYTVNIKEHEVEEGLHSIKFETINKKGKSCVIPVPPEEILVSRNSDHDLQKTRFVGHRCKKTISELNEMGFDTDDIGNSEEGEFTQERVERYKDEGSPYPYMNETDPSMREVWLTEAYPLVDFDGDGIAERRMVHFCSRKVMKYKKGGYANVEIDRVPIVTMTPIPMPHRLFGLSIADQVMDLQLIKSTVFRQVLDNMYLTNNSRMMALDGMVNIDDLLTVRPGGVVRVKAFDAVKPLQAPPLGAPAFQLLEYIDTIRENRTGVTRYNQGLDADSLNKTATGINTIYTAAQQRIELIARIFAETGIKDLFWSLFELECKHSTKPQVMRLTNGWVQVDPREWADKFDMSVSVGLGTGTHSMQMQGAQMILQVQQQMAMAGLQGRVITESNAYNAAISFAKSIDPKRAQMYFTDPSSLPPPQPQVDPKIQANMQKAQMQDETKRRLAAVDLIKQQAQFKHEKDMQGVDQTHDTNMTALDMIQQGMQDNQGSPL